MVGASLVSISDIIEDSGTDTVLLSATKLPWLGFYIVPSFNQVRLFIVQSSYSHRHVLQSKAQQHTRQTNLQPCPQGTQLTFPLLSLYVN